MPITFCSMCSSNIKDCTCEKKYHYDSPNIIDKAISFSKSALKHAKNLFENVPDPVQKERLQICSDCEFFNAEKITCNKCGCLLMIKTSWASESCPEGKWSSQERKKTAKKDCGCGKKDNN